MLLLLRIRGQQKQPPLLQHANAKTPAYGLLFSLFPLLLSLLNYEDDDVVCAEERVEKSGWICHYLSEQRFKFKLFEERW